MNKAIFLDRDNTINYDPGYLGDPNAVFIFDNVISTLKYFKDKYGYLIIIISNQAGVARKIISEDDVKAVNRRIKELFAESAVFIDAFYYCPHHPQFSSTSEVECRKPSPKMILDARDDFNIDISNSFLIGDMESDIESGINSGVGKTILIKHNISSIELSKVSTVADFKTNEFTEIKEFMDNLLG